MRVIGGSTAQTKGARYFILHYKGKTRALQGWDGEGGAELVGRVGWVLRGGVGWRGLGAEGWVR